MSADADRDPSEQLRVLYLDETAERERVVDLVDRHHRDIDLVSVESVPACQANLPGDFDCVVVELAVGASEPVNLVDTLAAAAPAVPIVAFTEIDITDLSEQALANVETLVQKGSAAHRRFLVSKLRGLDGDEPAGDESRRDELEHVFTDERVAWFVLDGETLVSGSTTLAAFLPGTGFEATPGESFHDRLERAFADGPALRQRLETAAEAGDRVDGITCETTGPDGATRQFTCWSDRLPGSEYRFAFFREVTDVVSDWRALEKLETLVELANDGLYTIDADARYDYMNQAFAEILGVEREELLGQHTYLTMAEGALRKGQKLVQHAHENPGEGTETIEQVHRRADGSTVTVAARAAMLPREDGSYGGMMVVARDITERKEREQALRERQADLEAQNEQLERFADMLSEKLQASLDEAEGQFERAIEDDEAAFEESTAALEEMETEIAEVLALAREDGRETDA